MTKLLTKFKEKPLWLGIGLLFVLVSACLRFLYLDNKPIHFDESINMWFVQRIWEDGFFKYDPTNYHGPLLFYLIQGFQLFTGFDYISTRWVASLFSFFSVLILWFGPEQHRTALRWTAVFLLLSPAMGFYGRSGIHESAFVFFQILFFLSFHYLVQHDLKKFWWSFAAGMLGMMALKETFVILILALIPALLLVLSTRRQWQELRPWIRELKASLRQSAVNIPLLVMFILFLAVYSGFGAHPKGIVDFFVALIPWLKTGVQGNGHEKDFFHWSRLFGENEFAIVAGFFLGLWFLRRNHWIRFYTVFSFFLWLIYFLIPYKTPWCIISILWPFAFVAGFALQDFTRMSSGSRADWKRISIYAFVALLFGLQSNKLYTLIYRDPIDMDHPYVYVNSTYQMKEFIAKTQEVIARNPLLREETVQIGTEESWPLPIVLKQINNLSYFKIDANIMPNALIYFVDMKDKSILEDKLKELQQSSKYQVFSLDTRQGRAAILVYVQKEYFQNLFSWDLKDVGSL